MITDVLDVAGELAAAIKKAGLDEILVSPMRLTSIADIHPTLATFDVTTVEGKRFKVTVEEVPNVPPRGGRHGT